MSRSIVFLLLVAAFCAVGLSAWAQDPGDAVQQDDDTQGKAAAASDSTEPLDSWIGTVETVVKAGGEETKSKKKIWHKGLRERVEEDAQGGVRVVLIGAAEGRRIVIDPGAEYAMQFALPEKGRAFFEQRRSAGMAGSMRTQGFQVVGPDEVAEEEILGIPCVVKELRVESTAEMREQKPGIPELMMFRLWEPKEPAGLPAALKLAQITKDVNVMEFAFTSLQRDPVIDEALFEVPEGMGVYDFASSVETVREKIEKTREEYLKEQGKDEETGGESPDEDADSGGGE